MMQTLIVDDIRPGDPERRIVNLHGWSRHYLSTNCIYSTVEQTVPFPYQTDPVPATVLKSRPDWYMSKDDGYRGLIDADKARIQLDMLLTYFISDFIEHQERKPHWIHFKRFIFPGEEYIEPMVVFYFYNEDPVEEIEYCDYFLTSFKSYLATSAADVETFKKLRMAQRKFRFIVRRE